MINLTIKKIPVMANMYWITDNALIMSEFWKIDNAGELWSEGTWKTCIAAAIIIRIIAILRIILNMF